MSEMRLTALPCLLLLALAACGGKNSTTARGCDTKNADGSCAPSTPVARCGDGVVDQGEHCDRGVANSDTAPNTCRKNCQAPRCGDGVIDKGEQCDRGGANSDSAPDACRTDCQVARCGDGVIDTGEQCDNGAANSDVTPDACRADCQAATCGDGVTDTGEQCDNGTANSDVTPDACRSDCQAARCGDGVIDTGEPCDDTDFEQTVAPAWIVTRASAMSYGGRCNIGTTVRIDEALDGTAFTTSLACSTGTWDFLGHALADGKYELTFTQINPGNGLSSVLSAVWIRDTAPPTFGNSTLIVMAGSSLDGSPVATITASISDAAGGVARICIKPDTASTPATNDPCWQAATAIPQGCAAAASDSDPACPQLTLLSYAYSMTAVPDVVFLWATDNAGNLASVTRAPDAKEGCTLDEMYPSSGPSIHVEPSDTLYLASSLDWQTTFSLVPATGWRKHAADACTANAFGICTSPLITYHREPGDRWDVDSARRFVTRYGPASIALVGTGSTPDSVEAAVLSVLSGGTIPSSKMDLADLIRQEWCSVHDVVYVENDYSSALLASTYASLIGAPLIIQGSALDTPANLQGKSLVCVFDASTPPGACSAPSTYSRAALQAQYLKVTHTDRIVLANPHDRLWGTATDFSTELSTHVTSLWGNSSLAAPMLAAAKVELVLLYDTTLAKNAVIPVLTDSSDPAAGDPITQASLADVEGMLQASVHSLFIPANTPNPPRVLTIVSSPLAIPDSRFVSIGARTASDRRLMMFVGDGHHPVVVTGRIYSHTVTDVSSYVARSLFYDRLSANIYGNERTMLVTNVPIYPNEDPNYLAEAAAIVQATSSTYPASCFLYGIMAGSGPLTACLSVSYQGEMPTDIVKGKQIFINYSHGNAGGYDKMLRVDNLPDLDLTYFHAFSCTTASFLAISPEGPDTSAPPWLRFGAFALRKGAIGFHGLVAPGSNTEGNVWPNMLGRTSYVTLAELLGVPGVILGDLDLNMVHHMTIDFQEPKVNYFTLLGDPLLAPKVSHTGMSVYVPDPGNPGGDW
jgi:hypothetical protein